MRKIIAWILCVIAFFGAFRAAAEDEQVFILCQPESWVNVRKTPKMRGEEIGRLELGDSAWTDGKKKNGFLHVYGMHFEEMDGWVYAGFVTTGVVTIQEHQQAVNRNKVACRRSIKGKRRKWLNEGDMVTVYAWSEEWAVTDLGFIMTKFLQTELGE